MFTGVAPNASASARRSGSRSSARTGAPRARATPARRGAPRAPAQHRHHVVGTRLGDRGGVEPGGEHIAHEHGGVVGNLVGDGSRFVSAHGTRTRSAWAPGRSPPKVPPPRMAESSQSCDCPRRQNQHVPQAMSNATTTRSPGAKPSTPSPTASTTPTASWPEHVPGRHGSLQVEEVQVRPTDRGTRDADDRVAWARGARARAPRPPARGPRRRTPPRARPSALVGERRSAPCCTDARVRWQPSRTARSWGGHHAPAACPASSPAPGRAHRARRPSTGSRARGSRTARSRPAPDRPGRRRGTCRATGRGSPRRRPAHRGRVRPRPGTRCRPPSPSRLRGNRPTR